MRNALRALARAGALSSLLVPAAARAADPGPPALVLAADGGVMARTLSWKDDIFGMLRDYTLPGAPTFGGEVAVYPGAFFTRGRLSWLGVAARAEGIAGASSMRNGHTDALPTHASAFWASLRGRLPLPFGAVWLDAGVAGRAFSIDQAGITNPDFPDVDYLGPRLGLGAELRLPRGLTVAPRAGVARWTSAGDVASAAWFPHALAWGVDAGLRVGWASRAAMKAPTGPDDASRRALRGFAPYLDLAWSRDVVALRPQQGDALIAGGLADDRVSVRLGIEWTLVGPPTH